MLVIADSGPVISLAVINKLELLETIYGEILISEAVWQEISHYIDPFNIPQVQSLKEKIKKLSGPNPFSGLMDSGEAEAASLYLEMNADYLIIDDRAARRTAGGFLLLSPQSQEYGIAPARNSAGIPRRVETECCHPEAPTEECAVRDALAIFAGKAVGR